MDQANKKTEDARTALADVEENLRKKEKELSKSEEAKNAVESSVRVFEGRTRESLRHSEIKPPNASYYRAIQEFLFGRNKFFFRVKNS